MLLIVIRVRHVLLLGFGTYTWSYQNLGGVKMDSAEKNGLHRLATMLHRYFKFGEG